MVPQREIRGMQEWLYVIIVGALALYLVIGVIAWTWMILAGRATPESVHDDPRRHRGRARRGAEPVAATRQPGPLTVP